MIDEEVMISEPSEEVPEQGPSEAAEPGPVPAPPEGPAAPSMEVISVDELLDRLSQDLPREEKAAEPEPVEETTEEEPAPDTGSTGIIRVYDYTEFLNVLGMDEVLNCLETIQVQTEPHPIMTTPLDDYTVTEGLLLLLFVLALLEFFLNLLRRWF